MLNREARISALKRYISLLEQEKKRLSLMTSPTVTSIPARISALSQSRRIAEKLAKAEIELQRVTCGLEPDTDRTF
jgi:hypothetical protein